MWDAGFLLASCLLQERRGLCVPLLFYFYFLKCTPACQVNASFVCTIFKALWIFDRLTRHLKMVLTHCFTLQVWFRCKHICVNKNTKDNTCMLLLIFYFFPLTAPQNILRKAACLKRCICSTFGSFIPSLKFSLCGWGMTRSLHPCLVNSSRLPVMISVAPHNEVQAWIRQGDDVGGGEEGVCAGWGWGGWSPCYCLGQRHIHCHSTLLCYDCWRKMCVPSTQPLFTLWLAVLLLGPGESESNTVVVCLHEACGRSPVWSPSSLWHVLVTSP